MEKIPVTNPLLESPNEFNYRLDDNEDSLQQVLVWKSNSTYSRNFENIQIHDSMCGMMTKISYTKYAQYAYHYVHVSAGKKGLNNNTPS